METARAPAHRRTLKVLFPFLELFFIKICFRVPATGGGCRRAGHPPALQDGVIHSERLGGLAWLLGSGHPNHVLPQGFRDGLPAFALQSLRIAQIREDFSAARTALSARFFPTANSREQGCPRSFWLRHRRVVLLAPRCQGGLDLGRGCRECCVRSCCFRS